MLLDIFFVILIVILFLLGRKRGVTIEFFQIFKFLLILFFIEFFYPIMEIILKKYMRNTRDNLEIYIINFIILYIIFSIILNIFKKFLKTIKLEKYNKTFGGILGIIKSTFIIFIIYIIVLIGSNHSKKLKEERDKSYFVETITEYGYFYTELFPQFIQIDVNDYRKKIKEKKLSRDILKDYKENKIEKGRENENKNNR